MDNKAQQTEQRPSPAPQPAAQTQTPQPAQPQLPKSDALANFSPSQDPLKDAVARFQAVQLALNGDELRRALDGRAPSPSPSLPPSSPSSKILS